LGSGCCFSAKIRVVRLRATGDGDDNEESDGVVTTTRKALVVAESKRPTAATIAIAHAYRETYKIIKEKWRVVSKRSVIVL
jgi:hypothetical protein